MTATVHSLRPARTVLVAAGRDYDDRAYVFAVLDSAHKNHTIGRLVHGACGWDKSKPDLCTPDRLRGGDRWADEWARSRGVPVERFPADWTRYGKAAGRKRIHEMFDSVNVDAVVAFPGGAGTDRTAMIARDRGIPVFRRGRAAPASGAGGEAS